MADIRQQRIQSPLDVLNGNAWPALAPSAPKPMGRMQIAVRMRPGDPTTVDAEVIIFSEDRYVHLDGIVVREPRPGWVTLQVPPLADAGATALAMLPFLAAGQAHKTRGLYQKNLENGIHWLVVHQKHDGDLSAGGSPKMLSHALATIALCEAFEMTGDSAVGDAAQKAFHFIVEQDVKIGGRSDVSGKPPTLSIAAWEIMAIRSAKMAGLEVPSEVLEKAGKRLASFQAADGKYGETGPRDASNAATAMGLLSRLYLGGNPCTLTVFGGKFTVFSPDESVVSASILWYNQP